MYIGNTPTSQSFISGTDYFNGTGSQTVFTLARSVNSVNDVEVVVNNVIQQPNSYTVSGTTLTLSAAPSAGTSNVYVRYLATNQQSFTVGNNTVGYNQLTADMQSKFAMKNRLINSAMVIDQRNAGASVTNIVGGIYTVDRFAIYGTQASKFTAQQNKNSVTPSAGFANYLGISSSSAYSVVAGDYFLINQAIEGFNIADLGWGTANAKTVTLSFQVYSSLTGTFGGSLYNYASTVSYPFTYTVSSANTWTTVSITIAGPTTGSFPTNNAGSLVVAFGLGVGSTYSGTAGTWASTIYLSATGATSVVGTNGATFYITGVQLEVGTSATGFEYRQYQQELALCQRYYQTANLSLNGYTGAGTTCSYNPLLPVTMRTTPTVAVVNTAQTNTSAPTGSAAVAGSIQYATIGVAAGGYLSGANFTISAEL